MSNTKMDNEFKLAHHTNHLSYYDVLDRSFRLYGSEYTDLKKGTWYSLNGINSNKQAYTHGSIKYDLRINLLIPILSGGGKSNLKDTIVGVSKFLMKKTSQPTSLHAEQLVGKKIKRLLPDLDKEGNHILNSKNKPTYKEKWISNYGYFYDDVLLVNDALSIMKGEDSSNEGIKTYFCQALDPYGLNKISKRSVDNLPDETLSYCSPTTALLLFQPYKIVDTTLLTGFMRRFLVVYVKGKTTAEEKFDSRLKNEYNLDKECEHFAKYLIKVKELSIGKLQYADDVDETLKKYANVICKFGTRINNKVLMISKIYEQSILDFLIKFTHILAKSYGHTIVTPVHVKLAFMDLFELFYSTLLYGNEMISGYIGYGIDGTFYDSSNNISNGKEFDFFKELYDREAFSLESSKLPIKQADLIIRDIYKVGEQSARNYRQKWKARDMIEYRQHGNDDSRIWLTDKAKNILDKVKEEIEFNKVTYDLIPEYKEVLNEYYELVEKLKQQGTINFEKDKVQIFWEKDKQNAAQL